MRGPSTVKKALRGRILFFALLVPLLALLVFGGAGASNRFDVSRPGRALPVHDGSAPPGHGIPPSEILDMVSGGGSRGVAHDGRTVTLSIDPNLQQRVFDVFERFDPAYGVFCAMDPASGRVLALVGYRRGGESDPSLALKAVYPAASLIKVVTASAALESGQIGPDDWVSYRTSIYDIGRGDLHTLLGTGASMTLADAMARSANAVFGKVAVNCVGPEGMRHYLLRYGFGERIPFDLPLEGSTAHVPDEDYELARTGAGFGEIYMSPVHVAMMMSAVGAGGVMPAPRLVDRVDGSGTAYQGATSPWRTPILPGTADNLLRMMVKTVEAGTSRRAFGTADRNPLLRDMEVAGKTGTISGWDPPAHFEWFAGVAPVAGPRIAVAALVVNDGKWKIKGSYVGKEAFSAFFGYPSSEPPVYAKAKGTKKSFRNARRKGGASLSKSGKGGRKGASVSARSKAGKKHGAAKGGKKRSGRRGSARQARGSSSPAAG
jgi:membrane peptidoglycan carboxypeptidase